MRRLSGPVSRHVGLPARSWALTANISTRALMCSRSTSDASAMWMSARMMASLWRGGSSAYSRARSVSSIACVRVARALGEAHQDQMPSRCIRECKGSKQRHGCCVTAPTPRALPHLGLRDNQVQG